MAFAAEDHGEEQSVAGPWSARFAGGSGRDVQCEATHV